MKSTFWQTAFFAFFLFFIWAALFLVFLTVQGSFEGIAGLFSVAYAIGHAAEFALGALIIMLLLSVLPRKLHGILCVLLGAGASLFLLVDYVVFRQFRLHIDLAMITMFLGDSGGDIFIFPMAMYVQAGLVVAAALVLMSLLWGFAGAASYTRPRRTACWLCVFFVVAVLTYNGIHAWARFNMYAPVTTQASALPLGHALSLNSDLKRWGFKPAEDLPRFAATSLRYPLSELVFSPPTASGKSDNALGAAQAKPLNLVVIVLDSWRFDMFSEDITPNIYKIAQKAQRFQKHNANANHTRHGIFSIFYGIPGLYWESVLVDRASPVLISRMVELGYEFGVWASAGLHSPEFDQTVFVELPDLELHIEAKDKAERDLVLTNKFLNFMDERDAEKPFFSFLFYDATHAYVYDPEITPPKFLPDGSKNYFSSDAHELELAFNRYKNSAVYVDELVGRVLGRLKAENLLEDTVVIITGDHGEEFDDLGLGYTGHNGNFSRFQVEVPMIVYWPGKAEAEYNYRTSHMDIVPTLMQDMFGCTSPAEDYSSGVNLFSSQKRPYIFMVGRSGGYGIHIDDQIVLFPVIGPSETVRYSDYLPSDWKMPSAFYMEILKELSRFRK